MGCRFSRTNIAKTESEFDSDSTDTIAGIINRPLLEEEDTIDCQPVSMTNATKSLNSIAVFDNSNTIRGMTTAINCIKNAYSVVRCDMSSIRSTFCNRITLKPKISLDPKVQESNITYINKPIKQVESASQIDFFRMLDEKIAQGCDDLIDSDIDE
ncbi:hypothetical protein WUBG_01651 [Wuchereria bancrofti]|uniref:Uncharacterized protein n=1 Tax=Wuchereria bancrofti TaxID=6293 RepID=J9EYY2_WUCBA|nr:hypothetical protein WUBG_01651 [Wuchereria bancrofti]VDM11046.1 unnamed protein product [Wuchereria bancrofti]